MPENLINVWQPVEKREKEELARLKTKYEPQK